jgi:hypothetical protein
MWLLAEYGSFRAVMLKASVPSWLLAGECPQFNINSYDNKATSLFKDSYGEILLLEKKVQFM